MKSILSIFLTLTFSALYAQDTSKVREINAIVAKINTSGLPEKKDTIKNSYPKYGLSMITFLTLVANDSEIIKYSSFVISTVTRGGTTKKIKGTNTFYYDHNKLIKVESNITEDSKEKSADWYYSDDQFIYSSLQSEKTNDMATMLLNLSKTLTTKLIKHS